MQQRGDKKPAAPQYTSPKAQVADQTAASAQAAPAMTEFEQARQRILQNPTDAFQVLGLASSATYTDIRAAFKKLSLLVHPDKNADPVAEDLFKLVNKAHEALKDRKMSQHASMPDFQHEFKHPQTPATSAAASAPDTVEQKLSTRLAAYFQSESGSPAFLPEVAVAPYYYKKGTPQQVKLGLKKPPQTAQEFYDLAFAIYTDTLTEREDSYFFTQLETPRFYPQDVTLAIAELSAQYAEAVRQEELAHTRGEAHKKKHFNAQIVELAKKLAALQKMPPSEVELNAGKAKAAFIVNLLIDAAEAGHQPSLVWLTELSLTPGFEDQQSAIKRALLSQGYRRVANQDGLVELEFWARKVPRSADEMESFARELETRGRVGTDYILSHPNPTVPRQLAERVRAQARPVREMNEQLSIMAKLAHNGEIEQVVKLTKPLLNNGKKIASKQLDQLVHYTNQMINEAFEKWLETKKNELAHLAQSEEATQQTISAYAGALLDTGEKVFTVDSPQYERLFNEVKALVDFAESEYEKREALKEAKQPERADTLKSAGPHAHALKEPQILGKPVTGLLGNFSTLHSAVRKNSEDKAEEAAAARQAATQKTDPLQRRYAGIKILGTKA